MQTMPRMENGPTRSQMARLVWTANAAGFPLTADDEHHLCQASTRPDDWEYLPNLAWDAQDWYDDNSLSCVADRSEG